MQLRYLLSPLLLFPHSGLALGKRKYEAHDYYAVQLDKSVDPVTVAEYLGLYYEGPLGELENHYIFLAAERQDGHDRIKTEIKQLKQRRWRREIGKDEWHILDSVLFSQKQKLENRFPLVKRSVPPQLAQREDRIPDKAAAKKGLAIASELAISDPIFQEQWHLHNIVEVGHDINVTGVWQQGITGNGSVVCILDDGLDMDSMDLKENYFAEGSFDFNDHGPEPRPRLSDDRHGTRCAGEISARRNDVCGVGVAYDGKVSACRILSKVITDADEAVAMNYEYQKNHIYSCSWGPPDDGTAMECPGILIRRAMVNGIQKGRSGLGSIFVFAIGNGAGNDDNCNFDGYTNSIYSVSVGGIDRTGKHPYYSERCSAQLIVTYSSGAGDAIHTTDVGSNTCYVHHGGTSAAGPLVAGIYSLVLQQNANMTWRDIQWLTVMTAVKLPEESDYQMNKAIGKDFSHQFGYGKADAYAMVEAAKTWKHVKPQSWLYSPWLHVNHDVPQGAKGLASDFEVTEAMLKKWNLERVEHVTVTMNVDHTCRGDLSVELRSPSGMVSELATNRRKDKYKAGYKNWTFMSVAHWGEPGLGTWTIVVKDTVVNEHSGKFIDWHLKLWGEAIDGDKQGLLPMPTENDDEDHDQIETQTASAHTMTIAVPTDHPESPESNPTDHPVRPTKPKPTPATSTAVTTSVLTPVEQTPSTHIVNFLPHPFPTFGVSERTQVWIYGAVALIILFLVALGVWYLRLNRKKRWMSGNDYGFELVDHDDGDENALLGNDDGHMVGATGKRKKRAGELYDALAEVPDDEHDMFELGSEVEDEDEADGGKRVVGGSHGEPEPGVPYRDEEPENLSRDAK